MQQSYEGKVQRIFVDRESFTVFTFQTTDGRLIKCVGDVLLSQGQGEHLMIEGQWVKHERFGDQFRIEKWEKPIPIGKEAVIEYLASGIVKGIGKKMGQNIVEKLGEVALDRILDEGPSVLKGIPRIGEAKAQAIYNHLKDNIAIQKSITKLMSLGLSPNLSMKVYRKWGDQALQNLQQNPYSLMAFPLVGFETADKLAERMGLSADSFFRVQAGLSHILNKMTNEHGHCYVHREEWIKAGLQLFSGDNVSLDAMENGASNLEANKKVMVENVNGQIRVYPKKLWYAESTIAKWIARRMRVPPIQLPGIENLVSSFEKVHGIILAEKQREAVKQALSSSVFVLTGGPGTGKTTVTKAILWCYRKLHPRPLPDMNRRFDGLQQPKEFITKLCAPTGRAARRMEEVTGHEASTIHRLLGMSGFGKEFDKDNPLPADFMIVDESSMIDIMLGSDLVEAIDDHTQVVLVGDVAQLPSVGPGCLLADLIEIGVNSVCLDVIHRQAQESNIVVNAHKINKGEKIQTGKDFFFVVRNDNESIKERLLDGVRKLLDSGWKAEDVQILTGMKKGDLGTYELNRLLQEVMNPPDPNRAQEKQAHRIFRVGDKVMQQTNNYTKEVFNGEVGMVRSFNKTDDKLEMVIEFADGMKVYERDEWGQLEHAYAITIHKSQGGEYPVVLMPITTSHWVMLYRNLLYTGVTRSKRLCGAIGMPKAWNIAIANQTPVRRNTGLKDRVVTSMDHSYVQTPPKGVSV